jgi:membrane protein implicated in regulation of membrane protease activity
MENGMETLFATLATLNLWHWFGTAVILIILELLLGASFVLLCLGISATIVGIALLCYHQLSWEYQLLLFAITSICSLLLWKLRLRQLLQASKHSTAHNKQPFNSALNRRSEQYIGRTVTLNEPIVNGRGRIHIDDSYWRVEGEDVPAGTLVQIIAVDGVVLKVERCLT